MTRYGGSERFGYAIVLVAFTTLIGCDGGPIIFEGMPVVTQDKAEWFLDQAMVGVKYSFDCNLTNHDSRPVKVQNAPKYCRLEGCIDFIDPPDSLPAHESMKFHFQFTSNHAGPIQISAKIFLESADKVGIAVPITIKGHAVKIGE